MNAIERGQLFNVSVQNIIDCAPVTPGYPPRDACGPGMSTEAMKLASTAGVTTPSVYGAYTASTGTCKAEVVSAAPTGQLVRIPASPGYTDVTPQSAVEFMKVSRGASLCLGPCKCGQLPQSNSRWSGRH